MRSGRIGKASARTTTLDLVTDKADRVRALAAERGAEVELQIAITAVIDRADTERLARTASAFGVEPAEVDTVPSVLVGTAPEITDRLGELGRRPASATSRCTSR
jgi:hypothetical protein